MIIDEENNSITMEQIEQNALDIVAQSTAYYEDIAMFNTAKVLKAFREHKVSDYYMKPTTGYGYSDMGRDKLDEIYADIFKAESALVRSQFVSGTHALAVAMLGNLKPGDELIGATGTPYDTLQTIIGYPDSIPGSLTDTGVSYKEIPFNGDNIDIEAVCAAISDKTKMLHIQRSCGYSSDRPTVSLTEIGALIKAAKAVKPDIICFVDNCYGEFAEKQEPVEVGADLVAGSLIKNLGGGLAPTGGYIVGKEDLVYNAACRLTAPGLAGEMGATLGDTARSFYQGLFLAPHVVIQAIKTAIYSAAIFEKMGYSVKPASNKIRYDIIQAITLGSAVKMEAFCAAIQANSPVDAYVSPVPDDIPGYQDKVIMAAGTFVQGASIELSADGPIRVPYNIYMQGGLTFEHGVIAVSAAASVIGPKDKAEA